MPDPKQTPVCMIAYANYFTDARIKNYVDGLLKAGYCVDVFALGQPERTRPSLRVFCLMPKVWSKSPVPYLLAEAWFLLLAAWRVALAHHGCRYAVVHVHNMPDFMVFAALIPKLLGAKLILDIHDTMAEHYATKFGLSLSHPLIALLHAEQWVSARFADLVITTNDLHKAVLVAHGVPAGKIEIILNVGNESVFRPQPANPNEQNLTLIYHGTIAARLGIDHILFAVREAARSCPNLRLILIGEGDFLDRVRDLVEEFGLHDQVSLLGFVRVEELPRYLCRAQVGIVGNRAYTEAKQNYMLPVKMLEYAAMEMPTIAPRLRIIEHYFDAGNAIFYEPDNVAGMADCIRRVYRDRDQLSALRAGLREFNRRYKWANMETHYLGLIERLIVGRGRKPNSAWSVRQ